MSIYYSQQTTSCSTNKLLTLDDKGVKSCHHVFKALISTTSNLSYPCLPTVKHIGEPCEAILNRLPSPFGQPDQCVSIKLSEPVSNMCPHSSKSYHGNVMDFAPCSCYSVQGPSRYSHRITTTRDPCLSQHFVVVVVFVLFGLAMRCAFWTCFNLVGLKIIR